MTGDASMQSLETIGLLASVDRELLEQRAVELLERLAEYDIEQAMTYFSDVATLILGRDRRAMPYFGSHQGPEAIRRAFRAVEIEYDVLRQDIRDMVIDQDRVVTRRVCRMRHRGTGKVLNVDFCDWIRFQDGLVCELSLAPETSQLEELVD
jgi:ketosteroid isomerase-like protein